MNEDSRSGGKLYVIATPIGNLGDMTMRAIETLGRVALVAAEDTRHTGNLLRHFQITTRLISYHEHNRQSRLPHLLEALGRGDVALVTDAGPPVISDPGQELVRAAASAGHEVLSVPGPSAPIAAASISGLDANAIHFIGFLHRKSAERQRQLRATAQWPGLLIFFEAPHRLVKSLADVLETLGDLEVAVCCELTKLYEQVYRGTISGALEHYRSIEPRGEFTVVLSNGDGRIDVSRAPAAPTEHELEDRFSSLRAELGDSKRALSALAAETGMARKALYARFLGKGRGNAPPL